MGARSVLLPVLVLAVLFSSPVSSGVYEVFITHPRTGFESSLFFQPSHSLPELLKAHYLEKGIEITDDEVASTAREISLEFVGALSEEDVILYAPRTVDPAVWPPIDMWPGFDFFLRRKTFFSFDNTIRNQGGLITQLVAFIQGLGIARTLRVPMLLPTFYTRLSSDVATGMVAPEDLEGFASVSFTDLFDMGHLQQLLGEEVMLVDVPPEEISRNGAKEASFCFDLVPTYSTTTQTFATTRFEMNSGVTTMYEEWKTVKENKVITSVHFGDTSAEEERDLTCTEFVSDWMVNSEGLLQRGDALETVLNSPKTTLSFKQPFLKKFLPRLEHEAQFQFMLLYNIRFSPEISAITADIAEYLRFFRTSHSIPPVGDRGFHVIHLRSEPDMVRFMNNLGMRNPLNNEAIAEKVHAMLETHRSTGGGGGGELPLYVASGHDNYDEIREIFSKKGLEIVTKHDLPEDIVTRLSRLPYEFRAAVDYMLSVESDLFLGYGFSFFSKVVKLCRRFGGRNSLYYNEDDLPGDKWEHEDSTSQKFFMFNYWLDYGRD